MIRIDLAKPENFHSQRNNLKNPSGSCGPTAMINALKASGVRVPERPGQQPEDDLSGILASDEAKAYRNTHYPTMKGIPPNEIHGVLSWAVNERFIGRLCTKFSTLVPLREIFFFIAARGWASVVSGRFTRQGHMVCVCGFESSQSDILDVSSPAEIRLDAITRIFLLDSWGDYHKGYARGMSGYDIAFRPAEFATLMKDPASGKAWAHLISADGTFS